MRTTFRARVGAAFAAIGGLAFVATTGADVALFRYEADVLPTDPSAGWTVGDPCGPTCSHTLANGVLSFHWPQAADLATYAYRIAEPPQPSHPSLWVEWRFRSNHIKGPNYFTCDAEFVVQYRETFEFIWMYADAAFDFGGDYGLVELDPAEFHLFRFESLDGAKYRVAVDGKIFKAAEVYLPGALDYIAFGGRGGCPSDQIPDMVNEWDMIRFGTIGFGEQIVSTDPPAGVLDPLVYPNLDRFLVTYDSPNYAYTDDITVEVFLGSDQATKRGTDEDGFRHEGTRARRHEAGAGDAQAEARERGKGSGEQGAPVSRGLAPVWPGAGGDEAPRRQVDPAAVPQVIATRRRDNGNPEDLEVVLDRPMPVGATTRFTFNDGVTQNVVEYTLGIPGICCLIGGGCAAAFDPTCTNAGGTFVPDGVCTDAQPCCLPSRQCQILDPLCCAAQNGTVLNSPDPCEGDVDDDGTDALCGDECPNDPAKLTPGVCGCGVSDTADADGDGVPDCTDQCPGADDAIFAPGCAVAIPAASQWGIMILALALGVAAKVRFGRARNRSLR